MNQPYLGVTTEYPDTYSSEYLFPITRESNRKNIGVSDAILPFEGCDVWNAYEISWLEHSGKPVVVVGKFVFPCSSKYIIESKSLKLYLNSFNQTTFASLEKVRSIIQNDLSNVVGSSVLVYLYPLEASCLEKHKLTLMEGTCIDAEDISVIDYVPNPGLLRVGNIVVRERLYSNLLKTNCLVTNQPDWASVQIFYTGKKIDKGSLLKYIVSFRRHCEFHEHCVERIFVDILNHCKPLSLSVIAKYTRRGGIDINPCRVKNMAVPNFSRDIRQ
ncbi:MAG: NADPH-dependent 7-cyano-7-deazaguanine reductase QueF [Legionellales bacterium]|nr:NADPH-dependent 7-cyano-7-deazaguanine reductase QueF [Legionellales bacterium]